MKLPSHHEKRLADLFGRLPNGTPKLRIVTPNEAKRPHGRLKGQPKYFDPESGKQMPFLIVEQWIPPIMAGSKEQWPYELLGAHPSECQEDCCNGGMWTFYTHLADEYGRYVPFGDYMIDALERRIAMDKKWRELSETERHLHTEAELSLAQQKKDEIALTEVLTEKEHYLTHKEEKDAADTRMRIGFGKQTVPDTIKGGKLPIGHSKLKL